MLLKILIASSIQEISQYIISFKLINKNTNGNFTINEMIQNTNELKYFLNSNI